MATFAAIPFTGTTAVEVGVTASTLKTVLQLVTPATTDANIIGWGVDFDSAAAGGEALCELVGAAGTHATVTSLTPVLWGNPLGPASLCVGGATATGYNASGEGTPSGYRVLDAANVNVQSGYTMWFPQGREPVMAVSTGVRIRVTSPASINCIPKLFWIE